MNIVIITGDELREEFLTLLSPAGVTVQYLNEPQAVDGTECYIDLLFEPTAERIHKLKQLQPALIIVNSIITTLNELPPDFTRINGWPTFLERSIVEVSNNNAETRKKTESVFSSLGKKLEWVPDIPGFITPRVISMIINEAYFALDEKISSKEEIDTAMKLGTNYPYGPFEWSNKIGLRNIYKLLESLSQIDLRYQPCDLLKQEVLRS